eukprot:COSAG01_NODE_363_length_18113_cov_45.041690_7_plen_136_part_00
MRACDHLAMNGNVGESQSLVPIHSVTWQPRSGPPSRHGRLLRHLPLLVVLGRAPRPRLIIIVRFFVVGATPSLTSVLPATATAAKQRPTPPPPTAAVAHAPTAPARLDGFMIFRYLRNDDAIHRTAGESQSLPRF